MTISVKQFVAGQWEANSYVVSGEHNTCVIIDPGDAQNEIRLFIDSNKLVAVGILLTHGHFDHIGGVKELCDDLQIPVFMHPLERKQLRYIPLYKSLFKIDPDVKFPQFKFEFLSEGCFDVDRFKINAIETPGHTEGSVCFFLTGHLFTGDTLFRGKIGRTDLPGGDLFKLKESLKRFSLFPVESIIYPGHGAVSILSRELDENIYFREVVYGT